MIISIAFCVIGWILEIKRNNKSVLASTGSLVFVIATIISQYKKALDWVNKEDWTALMDVMPSMFIILCVYAIVLIVANLIAIFEAINKFIRVV
ncbi:hypothetical protein [Eubacterium sp.]